MSARAMEFLQEWTLQRPPARISRDEADMLAEQWETDAADNGITIEELNRAAGGTLADYLVRTYGDGAIEL